MANASPSASPANDDDDDDEDTVVEAEAEAELEADWADTESASGLAASAASAAALVPATASTACDAARASRGETPTAEARDSASATERALSGSSSPVNRSPPLPFAEEYEYSGSVESGRDEDGSESVALEPELEATVEEAAVDVAAASAVDRAASAASEDKNCRNSSTKGRVEAAVAAPMAGEPAAETGREDEEAAAAEALEAPGAGVWACEGAWRDISVPGNRATSVAKREKQEERRRKVRRQGC